MSIRSDLHEYVRDQLDLPVTRVRLSRRPMLPALDLYSISASTIPHHGGPAGLVTKRFQFDVWAANDPQVDEISEALRRLLDGYRGAMGDSDIGSIFFDGEVDIDETPDKTSEPQVYHRAIDFLVTFRETEAGS